MQRLLFCWWTSLTVPFYFKVQRDVLVTVLLGESPAGRRLCPAGMALPCPVTLQVSFCRMCVLEVFLWYLELFNRDAVHVV